MTRAANGPPRAASFMRWHMLYSISNQTATQHIPEIHSAKSLWKYIKGVRPLVALTAPLVYLGAIPFALLDLFVAVYQAVCFPANGIPKVRRSDYLVFDRGRLPYLNAIEKAGCVYCSYANGLLAYVAEVAARTEQHFCPIRHNASLPTTHSRYSHFLPYGDSRAYREDLAGVRSDFGDVKTGDHPAPKHADG
jgi:hypothetical protein